MQKTILIYNDKNGKILSSLGGNFSESDAYQLLMTDVPDGYTVSSVNTETGEPIFEEIPKTEDQQRIEALERQMNALLGVSE